MRFFSMALCVCFFSSVSTLANTIPAVDENDPLLIRHSMIQTHTGFNQTEIHAVLPRMKNYQLKIFEIQNEKLVGEPIYIRPAIEARDPQGILLKKINIFHIDDLKPNTEYHMELLEKGPAEAMRAEEVTSGDTRRFRTLDPLKTDLRYSTASCLCDEIRYNDVKIPIWTQKRLTDPDIMFLLGDITYVDAFDYLGRKDITELALWQRYLDTFTDMPGTKMYRLKPVLSGWDDHDIVNGADKYSKLLKESTALFNLLWGGRDIPGIIENGKEGTYKWFSYAKMEFVIFDARSFREKYDSPTTSTRYGHLGQTQEEWFFNKAAKTKNPLILLKGDMWGSPLITEPNPGGEVKRIIEGFYADHPLNYNLFMKNLQSLPNPYVFYSGDIHRAQLIQLGPQQSPSRWNPYVTHEIVSSALYSHRFNAGDENHPGWQDPDRVGNKNIHNFSISSAKSTANGFEFKVDIHGDGKKNKDGTPRDWRLLGEPALSLSWKLKETYTPPSSCMKFYRR